MLFDIANTALAFSTAGSRPGMSPAERLAEAAVENPIVPKNWGSDASSTRSKTKT
jgi:hypothetical protein